MFYRSLLNVGQDHRASSYGAYIDLRYSKSWSSKMKTEIKTKAKSSLFFSSQRNELWDQVGLHSPKSRNGGSLLNSQKTMTVHFWSQLNTKKKKSHALRLHLILDIIGDVQNSSPHGPPINSNSAPGCQSGPEQTALWKGKPDPQCNGCPLSFRRIQNEAAWICWVPLPSL